MNDSLEHFNIINKIYTNKPNEKRNLIGLNVTKLLPYSQPYEPFKKIVKSEPINDSFNSAKKQCLKEWNKCTDFKKCNEMINLSQKIFSENLHMDSDQIKFYNLNKKDNDFKLWSNCVIPHVILKKSEDKKSEEKKSEEKKSENLLNSNNPPPTNAFFDKPLFINQDEYNKASIDYKYKIIQIIGFDKLNIINDIIKSGITDIKKTNGWDQTVKFTIVGGTFNGKSFYNKLIEIPMFQNLEDFKNPAYQYYKLNKLSVDKKYLSINDLYNFGMNNIDLVNKTLMNKNWDINTTFKIIGGDYDGKTFKNSINEVITQGFMCNIVYNIPFIGNKLCGSNDNSLYIIIGIVAIVLLIILYFVFSGSSGSSKSKMSLDKIKQMKLDKVLQMEYP